MNDNKIINELALLVSYSLENEITEEQFRRLEQILKSSKRGREYYYRLLATHASLSDANNIVILRNEKERAADFEVLSELLAVENSSPSIELAKQSDPDIVTNIESAVEGNSNKLRFYHRLKVLVSVAAVLILAVMMLHTVLQPVEIATVTKSFNTTLSTGEGLTGGFRLIKSDSVYRLKRGMLELTYDCDARLVIESPATFSVVGGKSLKLDSGRIYLEALSKEARGFTVMTPNSDVVDLGTEFGVIVDHNGISEVHMTKGSATLRSKVHQKQPVSQTLTAGNAGRVDYTGKITTIEISENEFARRFDQQSGLVWRGQDISLADFISGGNGLGDGTRLAAIDPETGKMGPWELTVQRNSDGKYKPIVESKYIDGVFMPDGGDGPVVVSSQDHLWNCPDTTGAYKYNIVSSLRMLDEASNFGVGQSFSDILLEVSQKGDKPVHLVRPVSWDNAGTNKDLPSIFIHANLGITYDLEEIRALAIEQRLSSFSSTFGIAEKFMDMEGVALEDIKLDLWILVDGKVKYSAKSVDGTKLIEIDVDLEDADKFLTLAVTEEKNGIPFDWGLFVNPVLKLERAD